MACPTPSGLAEVESPLKLTWLSNTSLELSFPEGTSYKILLTPTSNIPGEPTPDLYTGVISEDPDSRVTVSGGIGKETTVSIASKMIPGGLVDLCISSEGKTSSLSVLMWFIWLSLIIRFWTFSIWNLKFKIASYHSCCDTLFIEGSLFWDIE